MSHTQRFDLTRSGFLIPVTLHQRAFEKLLKHLGRPNSPVSMEYWATGSVVSYPIETTSRPFRQKDGVGILAPLRICRTRRVVVRSEWESWQPVTSVIHLFQLTATRPGHGSPSEWYPEKVILSRANDWLNVQYYVFLFNYREEEAGKENWTWVAHMCDPIECQKTDLEPDELDEHFEAKIA